MTSTSNLKPSNTAKDHCGRKIVFNLTETAKGLCTAKKDINGKLTGFLTFHTYEGPSLETSVSRSYLLGGAQPYGCLFD